MFRFFFGCMYRHRQFSGDPHPGNFLLLDDGRVAFLDFGLFKRIDAAASSSSWQASAPGRSRATRETLHRPCAEAGFIADPSVSNPSSCSTSSEDATWWYTSPTKRSSSSPRSPPR